ncbi:MAG: hypothetical protein IKL36_03060 [Clostridia bacterium]|nr:hypothetical protein [Clostridia bacterium]
MLNVFRNEGAIIRKLLGYQFASAIVGSMLSTASMAVKWLNCLTSILAVLLYCYFIYTAVWDAAAKDRLKVEGGRKSKDMNRGFKIALCANFPNIVLGVLAIILCAVGTFSQTVWSGSAATIVVFIARLWQAMYNGIINFVIPVGLEGWGFVASNLIYIAISVPAVFVGYIAYSMGYRNIRIFKVNQKEG